MQFPKKKKSFLCRGHLGCSPWALLQSQQWAPEHFHQESRENTKAQSSLWTTVGGSDCLPLLSLTWLYFSSRVSAPSHEHAPPSTSWKAYCQPASVLAPLWESSVLPSWDHLSWMHCSMTLESCSHDWKYRNHSKNLVLLLVLTEMLQP